MENLNLDRLKQHMQPEGPMVNTIEFSPVSKYGITKAGENSYEWNQWWDEQFDRCINGYSVGGRKITGDHYFYLNFWKIRGTEVGKTRKTLITPRFTDLDYYFFNELEKAKNAGKNMLCLKSRQKGFSEKAGALIAKNFTFHKASQSIITAGMDVYCKATMNMTKRGLNSLFGTEFYKRKLPDKPDYVKAQYKDIINGMPVFKGYMSEIFSITSMNNPQSLIGKQPDFVYFEEAGKFKGVIDVYKYIEPALETEGKKTGFALIVGTGGEMDQGVDELTKMYYNPDAYGLYEYDNVWEYEEDMNVTSIESLKKVSYFVPAYMYSKGIDKDGNSDIKMAFDYYMTKRERAESSGDAKTLYKEITQFPFSPRESLMVAGGNRFNIALLNKQLSFIRKSKRTENIVQKGYLEWKDPSNFSLGVEWIAGDDGPYRIIEHPEEDETGKVYRNLYVAGTDSYDRDAAVGGGSFGSTLMFKRFRNANTTYKMYVARITERPKTSAEFYESTAKLCIYYGKAINLIEYSNLLIFNWYEQMNLTYLLKERPRVAYANIQISKVQNKWGVDPMTKEEWIKIQADYIEQHYDKMWDPEHIEALINYREDKGYNCDITISSALAVVNELDEHSVEVSRQVDKAHSFFFYKSDNRGITTLQT